MGFWDQVITPRGQILVSRTDDDHPCVDSKKTPPCVDSKRPRVCRQHAHMLKSMCAWCRYTRGCFESTHGGVFESTHGVFSVPHHTTPHHTHDDTHDDTHTTNTRRKKTEREKRRRREKKKKKRGEGDKRREKRRRKRKKEKETCKMRDNTRGERGEEKRRD